MIVEIETIRARKSFAMKTVYYAGDRALKSIKCVSGLEKKAYLLL